MLTAEQEQLWQDYQAAESRGTRGAKLEALESFVAYIEQFPIQDWETWACDIAKRYVDDNEDFFISMPLFRRVIFPALLRGHRNQSNGCARWLAGLSQHLYKSVDCQNQLPPEERTELGLIRAAIRHHPSDLQSKKRLIELLADRLAYSIHELPAGVLYGIDGATPDQCMELQDELDEFAGLVEEDGQDHRFHSLIEKCRFHFQRYREYLRQLDTYNSYEHYLNSVTT